MAHGYLLAGRPPGRATRACWSPAASRRSPDRRVAAGAHASGGVAATAGWPGCWPTRSCAAGRRPCAPCGTIPWTGVGRGAFEGPAAAFRPDHGGRAAGVPREPAGPDAVGVGHSAHPGAAGAVRAGRPAGGAESIPAGSRCSRVRPAGSWRSWCTSSPTSGWNCPASRFPRRWRWACAPGDCRCPTRAAVTDRARPFAGRVPLAAWASGWCCWWRGSGPRHARRRPRARRPAAVQASDPPRRPPSCEQMVLRHPAEYVLRAAGRPSGDDTGRSPEPCDIEPRPAAVPAVSQSPTCWRSTTWPAGRRPQAAMEYRLAVERGHPFHYAAGGREGRPGECVPAPSASGPRTCWTWPTPSSRRHGTRTPTRQRPGGGTGRGRSEPARIRRMEIALASKEQSSCAKAAVELARIATTPRGSNWRRRGWRRQETCAGARTVLRRDWQPTPVTPGLAVRAARVLFSHGDLDGARGLLAERPTKSCRWPTDRRRAGCRRNRREAGAADAAAGGPGPGAPAGAPAGRPASPDPAATPARCACGGCGCPATRSPGRASPPGRSRSCPWK